jgi:hypothetical protein
MYPTDRINWNADFRSVTADDIRRNILELSRLIKSKESGAGRLSIVDDAQKLRAQFKAVWRARPGRPFRDIEARRRREEKRRKDKAGIFYRTLP